MQDALQSYELQLVLTLHRCGTLARAAQRLGQDSSTVFRALQKMEKRFGQRLFVRGRQGYVATELTMQLLPYAERIETQLEEARLQLQQPVLASGVVRIASTDVLFSCLLASVLRHICQQQPLLEFEILTGNELVSLSKRDADLAVRASAKAPDHLIAKALGQLQVAVYGPQDWPYQNLLQAQPEELRWLAVDQHLPEHPSVLWRKKNYPQSRPVLTMSSILAVQHGIEAGLGIGVLPVLQAERSGRLRALSPVLPEAASTLWLLAHPESRHLHRITLVLQQLAPLLKNQLTKGLTLPLGQTLA